MRQGHCGGTPLGSAVDRRARILSTRYLGHATIPTVLVDHIDLLPGAQSSIYGSDAIAGVANIVVKKSLDGPIADVRYGWTGGGADRRVTIGDGMTVGNTPKENVAQENLGTFIAAVSYKFDAGVAGEFGLDVSFTDILTHTFQQFAGDPLINYLNDPYYSTEFKTKGNGSLTWTKNPVSVTAYVERYGLSPNYIATTTTSTAASSMSRLHTRWGK